MTTTKSTKYKPLASAWRDYARKYNAKDMGGGIMANNEQVKQLLVQQLRQKGACDGVHER